MPDNASIYAVVSIAIAAIALIAVVASLMPTFFTVQQCMTAQDVMNPVLMTQYFDTLKESGASSRSNTILIPHSPGSLISLREQIRNAMIEVNRTVNGAKVIPEAFAGAGIGD